MKNRKIPLDLDCGLVVFSLIMGGKWKPCILISIYEGIKRPSEIHKSIPEATPRVLNMQLKELVEHGLIEKQIFAEIPMRVEYNLTSVGESLLPILTEMESWGDKHKEILTPVSN